MSDDEFGITEDDNNNANKEILNNTVNIDKSKIDITKMINTSLYNVKKTSFLKKNFKSLLILSIISIILYYGFNFYKNENIVNKFFQKIEKVSPSVEKILNNNQSINIENIYKYEDKNFTISNNKLKENLIFVIVLGDPIRSDRFGINGYIRKTTPFLSNTANTFTFKNVTPISNINNDAALCIMTNENYQDCQNKINNQFNKSSVASIFDKLEFKTRWIETEINEVFKTLHGSKEYYFDNKIDNKYGEYDKIFNFLDKNLENNQLIVFSASSNSHDFIHHTRYSKQYSQLKPDECATPECLNNAYDNYVTYIDSMLGIIKKKLENQNAILMFIPRGGESHSQHPDALYYSTIAFWFSDKYVKLNEKKVKNIRKNFLKNQTNKMKISYDNVFDSILDCGGIYGKDVVKSLSLCYN